MNTHDERLRRTKADMARRSCANPGSVTQAELDALPDPYNTDFADSPPGGLDRCAYMVYLNLGRGADAEKIRLESIPLVPIDVRPPPQPMVARPIPPSQAIRVNPKIPFASSFPRLKDLAVTACASPSQASLQPDAILPFSEISFAGDYDDHRAASLSAGLADCPRKLFYELIATIRSGKGEKIDTQWVRNRANVYSTPVYVSPPRNGGDPCRDNRNQRCP
jgi:hypothetical protein